MQVVQIQGYSGLGVSQPEIAALAEKIADQSSWYQADSIAVAAANMSESERADFASALILAGVGATAIRDGMEGNRGAWMTESTRKTLGVWSVFTTISAAACAYHGYKRNQSIGWAIWWFVAGGLLFPFTPVVAVAQGFGKPKDR